MKKIITLLTVLLSLSLFVGCSAKESSNPSSMVSTENSSSSKTSSNDNTTSVTSNGISETNLMEGEVYNSDASIYPSVELKVLENPSKGFKNLLIYVQPSEGTLEQAFPAYLRALKEITLQCYPAFSHENYTNVLFHYDPTQKGAALQTVFYFKLEPIHDKYRLTNESIADSITDYTLNVANLAKLGGATVSENETDIMLNAIADEKLSELNDIQ